MLRTSTVTRMRSSSHKYLGGGQKLLVRKTPGTPNPVFQPHLNRRQDRVQNALRTGFRHVFNYAMALGEIFFRCIRIPLAYFFVLVALWFGGIFVIGCATEIFVQIIGPSCSIPIISSLLPCDLRPAPPVMTRPLTGVARWADYPTLINIQSNSFEQLLKGSVGGISLSLEIKKAEMVTLDLITQVEVSNLHAKDSLAKSLSEFIQDAKRTGKSLQKLASKVRGAVDNIVVVNEYALQAITKARREGLSWKWVPQVLLPFKASNDQIKAVVMHAFDEVMSVLSNNMERLIIQAELSLNNLNDLEERLSTIHTIVAREDSNILSAKAELLEDMWTMLGGNRKSLRNFDFDLTLLKGIASYHREAVGHVVTALQTLQEMSNDMQDLRERVSAPNLIGEAIPAEVHIKNIQRGLGRLEREKAHVMTLEGHTSRVYYYNEVN